jgi:hypothetical protein
MEWEVVLGPIAAVVIFIGGQVWNMHDGDRRERRATRAARSAAFEQLQRETHLELQEALGDAYKAATELAIVGLAERDPESRVRTRVDHLANFLITTSRVERLESCLADDEARALASSAYGRIVAVADASDPYEVIDASDAAGEAMSRAINKLGESIREPPSA